jgi:hypothetical protein
MARLFARVRRVDGPRRWLMSLGGRRRRPHTLPPPLGVSNFIDNARGRGQAAQFLAPSLPPSASTSTKPGTSILPPLPRVHGVTARHDDRLTRKSIDKEIGQF